MTGADIRVVIADALVYASVPRFRDSAEQADFVAGRRDIRMADLEIDSLAAMELCIAIETNSGVSIVPGELAEVASLGALVERVERALAA